MNSEQLSIASPCPSPCVSFPSQYTPFCFSPICCQIPTSESIMDSMPIPEYSVGPIMGEKGKTLARIRNSTRTHIEVFLFFNFVTQKLILDCETRQRQRRNHKVWRLAQWCLYCNSSRSSYCQSLQYFAWHKATRTSGARRNVRSIHSHLRGRRYRFRHHHVCLN